ncbi:uncharacterized protein K489DRAFT_17720 [Dissoconium aciculare CBS 342.82]|uniref:Uncharacterized protein n=1 Tax=Dissoconium aciculare CBS 342.82 TaxID=1314786 RepID=A0A6J3MKI8_9PEZI|nr:uncharacterized protein K489DRAFT_17720 [Dissoconium aciculare CBS 342.82]KAF1827477.1 hypothetical protein K489DRAFT_17720 [Dissoconium aciculare CBS 342.82]
MTCFPLGLPYICSWSSPTFHAAASESASSASRQTKLSAFRQLLTRGTCWSPARNTPKRTGHERSCMHPLPQPSAWTTLSLPSILPRPRLPPAHTPPAPCCTLLYTRPPFLARSL